MSSIWFPLIQSADVCSASPGMWAGAGPIVVLKIASNT